MFFVKKPSRLIPKKLIFDAWGPVLSHFTLVISLPLQWVLSCNGCSLVMGASLVMGVSLVMGASLVMGVLVAYARRFVPWRRFVPPILPITDIFCTDSPV